MLTGAHTGPSVAEIAFAHTAVAALKAIIGRSICIRAWLNCAVDEDRKQIAVRRERVAETGDDFVTVALVQVDVLAIGARECDGQSLGRRGGVDGSGESANAIGK